MATHSTILAWKIPWTEELGRLQFMGLQGVRRDLATEQACPKNLVNVLRIFMKQLVCIELNKVSHIFILLWK